MLTFSAGGGEAGAAAVGGAARAAAEMIIRTPRIRALFDIMVPPLGWCADVGVRARKSWGRGDLRIPHPRRGREWAVGLESRSVVVAHSATPPSSSNVLAGRARASPCPTGLPADGVPAAGWAREPLRPVGRDAPPDGPFRPATPGGAPSRRPRRGEDGRSRADDRVGRRPAANARHGRRAPTPGRASASEGDALGGEDSVDRRDLPQHLVGDG